MKRVITAVFCMALCGWAELGAEAAVATEAVLRGMVTVNTEPVWAAQSGGTYPLSIEDAAASAKRDAALYLSGMVYGWDFVYEAGDKARGKLESIELRPSGEIRSDGIAFSIQKAEAASGTAVSDTASLFRVWADYELSSTESLRRASWRTGQLRQVNARGSAPLVTTDGVDDGVSDTASLHDAAKNAVRAVARGLYRDKPAALSGSLALVDFPLVSIAHGEWAFAAKFVVDIKTYYHL
jgi:hypothetical protein